MTARGAVAAGHPLTAGAAREVLGAGGNAFDAALAALCCACVAEPVLASLGGGGFLLAESPGRGECLYDFFVHTPRAPRPHAEIEFRPATVDFGSATQEFHIGAGSVATPGVVRGMFAVHADLGRMPMREVVAPALALARDGAPLNPVQAHILGLVAPIFTDTASARAVYTRDGEPASLLGAGDRLRLPAFADLLETLALEGAALFYEGEVAASMVAQAGEGGHLSREDLRRYRVERRQPLLVDFDGARLATNPPPSSGGVLIGFALQLLQTLEWSPAPWGSAAHRRQLAHLMELTNRARVEAQAAGRTGEAMLDGAFLAQYRDQVLGRAPALRGTTHVSVMDAAGNAAALSVSNGEGCGAMVPGAGFMLNNMLGEEDLNPGGFHRWPADSRMTSMMAPSLLRCPDGARVALGSGGSNRIRTAILQVLLNLLRHGLSVDEAVSRPRVHCEGGFLDLECAAPEGLEDLLRDWPGHKLWPDCHMYFGGVHCVRAVRDRFDGAGDPRRGGVFLTA